MAKFDCITIHPHALQQIMEACEAHQYDGPVTIVATGNRFTIRAADGLFLTEIENQLLHEQD